MKYGDVEVKHSSIRQFSDGLGVFALRDFDKGEVVIRYNLQQISQEEWNSLSAEEQVFTHKRDGIIYLYPDPERHINRHRDPNVYPDFERGGDIALRDIHKGEELTMPQEMNEDF